MILPIFRLVCDYGFIATNRTLFECGDTEEASMQATCVQTMAFVIGTKEIAISIVSITLSRLVQICKFM